MCGICGIYDDRSDSDLKTRVTRMARSIAHRGPDGEGVFVDAEIGLGHRRLSIIDLTENGAQPMTLGAVTIVHNGECYNFAELRSELERMGRRFRGHSDTEVILHVYDAWGVDGLSRLEGMFAFALWDSVRRRLIVMRDRLGIKPLFYAWREGRLVFGSEIKAIFAGLDVNRSIDSQALSEFLWYGNSFEDRTLFSHVRALQPGHRLIVEGGRLRIDAWWRLEQWLDGAQGRAPERQAAAEVVAALDDAVARQMVSDVPLGIFLSGGLDSSSIAASASIASAGPVQSFSVGFDFDRGGGELPQARRVAEYLKLDHHEIQVRGDGLEEVIHALVIAHDEPFADAANIPLYLLAKGLDRRLKVVLQGDGGDEMFAGYRRYSILSRANWWRFWPSGFSRLLRAFPRHSGTRLARLGSAASQADNALRMALLLTVETMAKPPTALLSEPQRGALAAESDPFAAFKRCAARFAHEEPVQQMLLTDLILQLPSQFLAKVDRATMTHGLESRVPLLDEGLAAVAVGMPSTCKVRGSKTKIVLREAGRGRIPSDILDGPKRGFGVPYEKWLRGPLYAFARSAILDRQFVERFGIDAPRAAAVLEAHRAGRSQSGFLIWKLLQLSLWSKQYLL